MSQFIYPYTNIPMSPYYLLPFQSGIWHLMWYLAFFILYLASGLWFQSGIWHTLYSICNWHPIWYLAAGIKNFLNLIFQEEKALNILTHIPLNNSWSILQFLSFSYYFGIKKLPKFHFQEEEVSFLTAAWRLMTTNKSAVFPYFHYHILSRTILQYHELSRAIPFNIL